MHFIKGMVLAVAMVGVLSGAEENGHLFCSGGQAWTDCGKKCVATCDEPAPVCSTECQKKCECPPAKPIWHEKLKMCGVLELCQAKVCSHTSCFFDENNLMKMKHDGKEEHGTSTRCMESDGACVCYCTTLKLHEEL